MFCSVGPHMRFPYNLASETQHQWHMNSRLLKRLSPHSRPALPDLLSPRWKHISQTLMHEYERMKLLQRHDGRKSPQICSFKHSKRMKDSCTTQLLRVKNCDCFLLREFLRLGNPLNCGAWDKKLLKQYRVHKPSSLSYDTDMRSE